MNQGINNIEILTQRDIAVEFLEEHRSIFDQKRGDGYWLWKPYLLSRLLEKAQEGDIVMYIDSGISLIRGTDNTVTNFIKYIRASEKDIFLKAGNQLNGHYTKRAALLHFGLDTEEFRNESHQLEAAIMVLKNTQKARDFVNKWLEACGIESILTDLRTSVVEHGEFKDHRHDQALLTLLYYNNQEDCSLLTRDEVFDYNHHRRRNASETVENKVFKW